MRSNASRRMGPRSSFETRSFGPLLRMRAEQSPAGPNMDVFEAVDSRIACRAFLDRPVDLKIVKDIIVKAQRVASGGNLQSWNVYALTGTPDLSRADVRRLQGAPRGAWRAALWLARHRSRRRGGPARAIQEELRILRRAGGAVHHH